MNPGVSAWWRRHALVMLYAVAAAAVSVQRIWPGRHGIFLVFRTAFFDLVARRNLYVLHDTMDYFRYSPTFALFFAPFALAPLALGIALWTFLNAFALYAAIGRLLPARQAAVVRVLVLGDLVRSIQNSQSNALVTALMIAAYLAYENGQAWRAAWSLAAGGLIKVFPLGAGLFALISPRRPRSLAAILAVTVLLILAPALIIGPDLLLAQYYWWSGNEAAEVYKAMFSVMDLIEVWTGHYHARWIVQLAGLVILLLPVVLRRDRWADTGWRLRLLCSVLMFCVLFNHGAESPSYVIATTGVCIWWAATPRSATHDVLLLLTLLLSTVARSSLIPVSFRVPVLDASRSMVMPVLASWLVLQAELLRGDGRLADQGDVAAREALPHLA